jgi:hypothetical protein
MDRRRFLSLFSAASAAAVLGSSGLLELPDSAIQLANFDVQFNPPRDWVKYVGYEVTEAFPAEDMVLPDGAEMPDLANIPTPILSFSKYREPIERLNPQIFFFADRIDEFETANVLELARFSEADFCGNVRNPRRLVRPQRIRLNDFDAAVALQSFQFDDVRGLSVRAVRHITLFAHKSILYAIMMTNASSDTLLREQIGFHVSVRRLCS